MKRDIAERFAALVVEGLTTEQVGAVIAEFLAQIVRCPVCDGAGTITFGRDVEFPLAQQGYHGSLKHHYIPEGTVGTCPRCGGSRDGSGAFDPEWVAWHCWAGSRSEDCRRDQEHGEKERREEHSRCGYRIMLPLPEDTA